MNKLVVDYLIVIPTNPKKEDFICTDIDSFKNLLKVNSELVFEAERIGTKQVKVDYEIKMDANEEHKLFYLTLVCEIEASEDIEQKNNHFSQLTRHIKTAIYLLKDVELHTLWDDISFYYSQKSYPLIHQVENLMRKLITKFMVKNVGIFWSENSFPDGIKKENQRSKNRIGKENPLYQLDFIHLADFLLKSYQNKDIDELYDQLRKAKEPKDLILDELKKFIPRSNWERYFSRLIQYEGTQFKKQWEKLYDLRCKIAHNNIVIENDYKEISELSLELTDKLKDAISKLDEIELSENEKGTIRENIENISINIEDSLSPDLKQIQEMRQKQVGRTEPHYNWLKDNLKTTLVQVLRDGSLAINPIAGIALKALLEEREEKEREEKTE